MKYIFFALLIFLASCTCTKETTYTYSPDFSFKEELNASVIDGFYDNDTIGKSNEIYLLK